MTTPTRSSGSSDVSGLARRGGLSLAGAAVSAVTNLALIVLVTRNVDKQVAGVLFSATSLFVVLEALCALGTATGVVYFIARSRALGHRRQVRDTLRLALVPVAVVSVLVALALLASAPLAGPFLGGADGVGALFLRLLACFLPLAVLYDVLIAATQGFHTMTATVVLEKVGRPLLQFGALGIAVLAGASWMLPVAWVGPYVVALGFAVLAIRRLIRHHDDSAAASPYAGGDVNDAALKRGTFWSYTAPRGVAATAQLCLQRLDIILVAAYLGAAPAAIYTAATRFVVLGQLGSQAVALAVQPKLSELMARDDRESTLRVYRVTTAWVIAVTWPIHLSVAMLAPLLLALFGPGYAAGRDVTVLLALSMLVATGCGMVTTLLLMAGRSRENLFNVVVALVVNVTLNVILIPRMGIEGAAIAWAAAIVLSNLLPLWQVRRAFGLDPFGSASAKVALLSIACLVLPTSAAWLLSGAPWVVVAVHGVGCAVYVVGLGRLRHAIELDDLVQSVRRKLRPRRS